MVRSCFFAQLKHDDDLESDDWMMLTLGSIYQYEITSLARSVALEYENSFKVLRKYNVISNIKEA